MLLYSSELSQCGRVRSSKRLSKLCNLDKSRIDDDAPAIVAEYLGLTLVNLCTLSGSTLVIYEHLITLDMEIKMFWKSKANGAAVLFFLNRYVFLLSTIFGMALDAPVSDNTCEVGAKILFTLRKLPYIIWGAFSALRAYALGRNLPLSVLVFLLSNVSVGINMSEYHFGVSGVNVPVIGCAGSVEVDPSLSRSFTTASRTCLMTADVILIYVTWNVLLRKRGTIHNHTSKNTFASVLLRDGIVYFLVLLVLNSVHLALTMLSLTGTFQNASYVTQFTEPITAILVSRFLIHLQAANRQVICLTSADGMTSGDRSHADSLVFERVVGSLGSSIDFGIDDGEEDGTTEDVPELAVGSSSG